MIFFLSTAKLKSTSSERQMYPRLETPSLI